MKPILIDHVSNITANSLIVEGKTEDGRVKLKGKLQEAERNNGNGRVYPYEILKREIDKYIDGPIKNKTSTGELDHPESSIINLSNVSHLITNIWWQDTEVWGDILLLNTPSGRIAQEIILAGIPLGISSRGMGSVKQIGENVEVQNDYDLLCWDLVSTPSTPGAFMRISEGLNPSLTAKYAKINSVITDIICSRGNYCPCELK